MIRNLPTIGATGGIFEVFVPGLFMLFNFLGMLYFIPSLRNETISQMSTIFLNPALDIVIIICFGYLLGVLLRIFRVSKADHWSGVYLRYTSKSCKTEKRKCLYAYQDFPYVGWLGVVCQREMPKQLLDFYYTHWAYYTLNENVIKGLETENNPKYKVPQSIIDKLKNDCHSITRFRNRQSFLNWLETVLTKNEIAENLDNIQRYAALWGRKSAHSFYNFCKIMLIAEDQNLSNEIYHRASLTRYISSMFYALVLSCILIFCLFLSQLVLSSQFNFMLLTLLIVYIVAILSILKNLRYMRVSEAQTVFYATFKHQDIFEANF